MDQEGGGTPGDAVDRRDVYNNFYRFAPKASRRPSQSFTTNSRLCQGMLPSPRVNSTPWAAYSAKTVASDEWRVARKPKADASRQDSGLAKFARHRHSRDIFCARLPRANAGLGSE